MTFSSKYPPVIWFANGKMTSLSTYGCSIFYGGKRSTGQIFFSLYPNYSVTIHLVFNRIFFFLHKQTKIMYPRRAFSTIGTSFNLLNSMLLIIHRSGLVYIFIKLSFWFHTKLKWSSIKYD